MVAMPRMFFVPTEPSWLRKPSKVYPSSCGSGAGTAVEIGRPSSEGAGGRTHSSLVHPAALRDRRSGVSDHLSIANDGVALGYIRQSYLVRLRDRLQKRQPGIELSPCRQTTFIGDNRYVIPCMDLDAQGVQSTIAGHAIPHCCFATTH